VETLGQECGRPVCSLAWSQRGTYLAAGEDGGAVQIYDAATARRPRRLAALRSTSGIGSAFTKHEHASCGRRAQLGLLCVRGGWAGVWRGAGGAAAPHSGLTGAACLCVQGQAVRGLREHGGRVGALAWGGPVLASGSWDRSIRLTDVRAPGAAACLSGHSAEVCGLRVRARAPGLRS